MSEEIKLNEGVKKVVKTPLIITSAKELEKLKQENEKLHSIIKEVREYIEKDMKEYGGDIYITCKDILEILDKENI